GTGYFSFHSISYRMNERSKKNNGIVLANEPKAYLSAYLNVNGHNLPAQGYVRQVLLVIGVEWIFRQLQLLDWI
ncbi:MAG: hypothetical protein AAGA77_18765, partial [Bacteroidota bacterium]